MKISLLCSLNILFLRRDIPGSALSAGDIDNRIKTVIDALRRPRHANELAYHATPAADEDPFFRLLEDDSSGQPPGGGDRHPSRSADGRQD